MCLSLSTVSNANSAETDSRHLYYTKALFTGPLMRQENSPLLFSSQNITLRKQFSLPLSKTLSFLTDLQESLKDSQV